MRNNRNNRGNVHYDPALRSMVLEMWMSGKTPEAIERAIGRYLSNRARRRRGGAREREATS